MKRSKMEKFVKALGYEPNNVFEVTLTPDYATVTSFRNKALKGAGGFDIKDIPWEDDPGPKVGDTVKTQADYDALPVGATVWAIDPFGASSVSGWWWQKEADGRWLEVTGTKWYRAKSDAMAYYARKLRSL